MMTFKKRRNFVDYLNTLDKPIGVEIGTHRGHYMSEILEGCKTIKMFAIDLWIPSEDCPDAKESYQMCQELVAKYNGRLELIREWSSDAAAFFRDEYFDFVYIDCDHSYESTKEDIEAWHPKCKSGGLFAGHDYSNKNGKGVKKAVDEKFGCDKIQSTSEVAGSWFLFKQPTIIKQESEPFVSCEIVDEDGETKEEIIETTGDCL